MNATISTSLPPSTMVTCLSESAAKVKTFILLIGCTPFAGAAAWFLWNELYKTVAFNSKDPEEDEIEIRAFKNKQFIGRHRQLVVPSMR